MSSPDSTSVVRNWHFILHTQAPLTPAQRELVDHLDCFADGDIDLEERADVSSRFTCYLDAEDLTEAIAEALARMEHLPGVLIRSVELSEYSLDHNGMATPAVLPLASGGREPSGLGVGCRSRCRGGLLPGAGQADASGCSMG